MKTKTLFLLLILLGCFNIQDAFATLAQPSAEFTKIKDSEPDFEDIMRVFEMNNNLGDGEFHGWEKKIKKAAYMPTLYLGYDHQFKESESLSVTDNISLSGGIVTVGPEDNDYDIDNDEGQTLRVRAVWNLDEVVFNRYLFALENARSDRLKSRARIAQDIFKIYEERYLYLAQYLSFKRSNATRAQAYYMRFLILTDRLNQITQNQFAEKFWREK